jgi:adenylate cyclase
MAVCFVDIVGYTSRSKSLDEAELVAWLEHFEDAATGLVVDRGGRIIKTIGDEVLFVTDRAEDAAEAALEMTARGADDDDPFPAVRAGIAYGDVVSRLGDVFGPTVNVAARLTSVARPGAVLVDQGCYEELSGRAGDDDAVHEPDAEAAYSLRRTRRVSVKGYSKLQPWVLRRA